MLLKCLRFWVFFRHWIYHGFPNEPLEIPKRWIGHGCVFLVPHVGPPIGTRALAFQFARQAHVSWKVRLLHFGQDQGVLAVIDNVWIAKKHYWLATTEFGDASSHVQDATKYFRVVHELFRVAINHFGVANRNCRVANRHFGVVSKRARVGTIDFGVGTSGLGWERCGSKPTLQCNAPRVGLIASGAKVSVGMGVG